MTCSEAQVTLPLKELVAQRNAVTKLINDRSEAIIRSLPNGDALTTLYRLELADGDLLGYTRTTVGAWFGDDQEYALLHFESYYRNERVSGHLFIPLAVYDQGPAAVVAWAERLHAEEKQRDEERVAAEAAKRQVEQEARDRAEYERLKQKYGT